MKFNRILKPFQYNGNLFKLKGFPMKNVPTVIDGLDNVAVVRSKAIPEGDVFTIIDRYYMVYYDIEARRKYLYSVSSNPASVIVSGELKQTYENYGIAYPDVSEDGIWETYFYSS